MKKKQKFKKGTIVRIADDLGESMSHFDKGCLAVVAGTYSQQYGGTNVNSYTLYIIDKRSIVCRCSWYEEHQLTETKSKLDVNAMVARYHLR